MSDGNMNYYMKAPYTLLLNLLVIAPLLPAHAHIEYCNIASCGSGWKVSGPTGSFIYIVILQ